MFQVDSLPFPIKLRLKFSVASKPFQSCQLRSLYALELQSFLPRHPNPGSSNSRVHAWLYIRGLESYPKGPWTHIIGFSVPTTMNIVVFGL